MCHYYYYYYCNIIVIFVVAAVSVYNICVVQQHFLQSRLFDVRVECG